MACNKMNQTRRCAGRLRLSIWLKCRNKLSDKKVLYSTMNFLSKDFWGRFNSKHGYKTINKRSQNKLTSGTAIRENHHVSHFRQDQRPLTPYGPTSQSITRQPSPLHFHHKILTTHSLPTHINHYAPYNPASQPVKNNLHPLTS